ncbi:sulfite exporter TauE/SafE family protein [Fulvivirga sp. RKSG066]|uniref:sulfite exporter TauE/SafE family protein n=1 Tax=Fulvivirga aurantia TaxID=2529383 RepID=UPI0012BD6437|nr:sulfite exporter TauE/SafE family protein [Fulvivirga aurantia]MTI22306.1 sulfite exporter TauE/SafE family protein [Fulvivirga aurantia]
MSVLEIFGYIGAAAIGISLGLIGGGGSILTVPVLVYLLAVEPILATAYSLFIVGFTALVGGINYARKGLVSYRTGIVFTIPAFIAVYLTRRYLVPSLPDLWFSVGTFTLTKDTGILLIFAALMVFASISMIRNNRKENGGAAESDSSPKFNYPMIILEGVVVGALTGMVGAGGGFLIIPALVLFAKLPMKTAIGTSLLIIATKSLIGFIGDIQAGEPINWVFLTIFSAIAVLGIFIGTALAHKIDGSKLKKAFGYFVLVMGAFMIVKELLM